MVLLARLIFIMIFEGLTFYSPINLANPSKKNKKQPQNHPPVVKIISPANNAYYAPNEPVVYGISISDQEDGESKYDEINPKEVLLKVKYIYDESKLPAELSRKNQNEQPGLAAIITSNCFNCHKSNSKSIGPSFYAINKKYPATAANAGLLAKRIRKGSSGIWGKARMPTHPELTARETQNIVKWIFRNSGGPDINYYTGTDGSFRTKPPTASKRKGAYVLTASYIDHGPKDGESKQHLSGRDIVIIHIR